MKGQPVSLCEMISMEDTVNKKQKGQFWLFAQSANPAVLGAFAEESLLSPQC